MSFTENFQFLEVKFSIYFNRHVFVLSAFGFYWPSSESSRNICILRTSEEETMNNKNVHVNRLMLLGNLQGVNSVSCLPSKKGSSLKHLSQRNDKTYKMACAPSEEQPGHQPGLIRVFALRSMGS